MSKKVFLAVGHGGSDPGAVANGFKEKDLNLAIALKCKSELERHGIEVLASRVNDAYDPLENEIKECNAFNPDIAVAIHNNAGGGDGAEAWRQHRSEASKNLAEAILAEIVKVGQNSRGVKTRLWGDKDYYGFNREVLCTNIIVECAFVDNATDMKIIDTKAEQEVMGVAVAKGILNYFSIPYKNSTTAPEHQETPKNNDYKVGSIVAFSGGKHYISANASSGYAVPASKARVTAVSKGSKHPYHLRAINSTGAYTNGVYGWVDASSIASSVATVSEIPTLNSLQVGDIVTFTGNTHYATASAAAGSPTKFGRAKVTAKYPTGKHQVHLRAVDSNGAFIGGGVYGWVNLSDIKV